MSFDDMHLLLRRTNLDICHITLFAMWVGQSQVHYIVWIVALLLTSTTMTCALAGWMHMHASRWTCPLSTYPLTILPSITFLVLKYQRTIPSLKGWYYCLELGRWLKLGQDKPNQRSIIYTTAWRRSRETVACLRPTESGKTKGYWVPRYFHVSITGITCVSVWNMQRAISRRTLGCLYHLPSGWSWRSIRFNGNPEYKELQNIRIRSAEVSDTLASFTHILSRSLMKRCILKTRLDLKQRFR